jgi:hypothetical protein
LVRRSTSTLSSSWQASLGVALATAVVIALCMPMLVTSSGFAQDWIHHLWYLWRQSAAISRDHLPSLFLNDGIGVFYPFYGYYGGTLYALGGALSLMLGDAPTRAYVLTYVLGMAASYGGFYWLARMAGVGRWLSHAPGFVFVTAPYTLTLIYARGAWPEFMAVSAMPLLVAAAVSILRAGRLQTWPALALAGSTVVFTGSHNITLLWGVTLLGVLVAIWLYAVPQSRPLFRLAGLARLAAVAVPSVLVNAWFLIPDLAYSSRTNIGRLDPLPLLKITTSVLTSFDHLFTLSRATAATGALGTDSASGFVLALPVLAMLWVLVGLVIAYARRPLVATPSRRALVILVCAGLAIGILMTHSGLIADLPKPYHYVQYSYRLESYLLMVISGAMIAALAFERRQATGWRSWRILLGAVVVASAIGAATQVANHPNDQPDRGSVFDPTQQPPPSQVGLRDYDDASLPTAQFGSAPVAAFAPREIRHERARETLLVAPTQRLVRTNVVGAPYFVDVEGGRIVGRAINGTMVLALPSEHGRSVTVTVRRAANAPTAIGRTLSALGALSLLLLVLAGLYRSWRGGRHRLRPRMGAKLPAEH